MPPTESLQGSNLPAVISHAISLYVLYSIGGINPPYKIS